MRVSKPRGVFYHNPPTRLLFGPGPSNIDPRVQQSLSTNIVGHLDPYFVELMAKIQDLLRWVWQTKNEITVPVSGTGSAAMETAVANLVEPGDVVVVGVNGYFGARLAEMARRYGAVVHEIKKPWGQVYSLEELQNAIDTYHPKLLALVHGETSTGSLQPMDHIGDLCHDNDCLLLLDVVTTTGGVPVLIDEWGVDAAYSCTQKCIGVSPGLAPLTFSPLAMEIINNRKTLPSTWYLDIKLLLQYWGGRGSYHHTAPISMNYGLYQALCLIYEEGLQERWERHARVGKLFADGVEKLGLSLKIENPKHRMPQVCTIAVPTGVNPSVLINGLREKYNIEISGGLGELAGQIWRIGLMGYNATEENVELLLTAINHILFSPKL